jgi:hypothetical protein
MGEWRNSSMYYINHGTRWGRVVRFITAKEVPGTHFMGGLEGLRAELDAVAKRHNLCLCLKTNPSYPALDSVTILTELPRIFSRCNS